MVRLEALVQLKIPMTSPGIEPPTFGIVEYCLNQQYQKETDRKTRVTFSLDSALRTKRHRQMIR
jgi:hypothetical protein